MSDGAPKPEQVRPSHVCESCWDGDHSNHRTDLAGICIGCSCGVEVRRFVDADMLAGVVTSDALAKHVMARVEAALPEFRQNAVTQSLAQYLNEKLRVVKGVGVADYRIRAGGQS